MLPRNKRHLKKAGAWGGGAAAALAALSLVKYPPPVAAGILAGAAIGVLNLLAIIRLVEVMAGLAGAGPKAVKVFTVTAHAFKLAALFGVLFLLVYLRLTNLLALLAGFTLVLAANVLTGLSTINADG